MKRARYFVMGLLLAAFLAIAVATPALATGFSDIDGSPFEASINALASREYIGGYSDGTFRPDNPLQRGQFAKMAVLTMGFPVTIADVCTFKDTPAATPANPLYPGSYVAVAAANSIIKGYPDNTFRFYTNVTRQQAITMIVRAAGAALTDAPASYEGYLNYSDSTHGANVKKAEFNGLLAGIPDLDAWSTTENATRGETAEMLAQLYYRTGVVLTLSGTSGTQEFTLNELKALASTQGYGGWKNILDNITGPKLYKGVSIQTLMSLVGGGTSITVEASDGYRINYDSVALAGNLGMFNPTTKEPITAIPGHLTMILAYEVDGGQMFSDEGALRIAFVSAAADQVTDSKMWAKQVAKIEVK
jgi:hypothetical protein